MRGSTVSVLKDYNTESFDPRVSKEMWRRTGSAIAKEYVVKVRISRQPRGTVDGISLQHYHPGRCYDLPASLAQYLVAEGFGIFEMRGYVRSKRVRPDRRKAYDPPFSSEGLSSYEV
jgi:hypothetical protein